MRSSLTVLALLLIAACASAPSAPVALEGAATDLQALAGTWVGEYSSKDTGRSGSITFQIDPEGDHAVGDVLMLLPGTTTAVRPYVDPAAAPSERRSELLTIRFVGVSQNQVRGTLDEYIDPTCNCILRTTFTGRIEGDKISGIYASTGGTVTSEGRWSVRRER
jgi:hypothetical protein